MQSVESIKSSRPLDWWTSIGGQALDEDQEGDMLDHRTIFEEDRDFNQGTAS